VLGVVFLGHMADFVTYRNVRASLPTMRRNAPKDATGVRVVLGFLFIPTAFGAALWWSAWWLILIPVALLIWIGVEE
jgi:hypothetical protein